MTISINNASTVLAARQSLEKSGAALSKNFQRLSSGLKINSASDGGGAVAVAMRMASQISGTTAAKKNANDALSLLQVADSALNETATALQKVRDLAVNANTDTKSSNDRLALKAEVTGLVTEINRLATGTEIFSKKLLDGTLNANVLIDPNVGTNHVLAVALGGTSLGHLDLGTSGSKLNVSTAGSASAAIAVADAALNSVALLRATVGAMQNRLESIINSLDSSSLAYTEARSRVMDADVAEESSDMARNTIRQQAAVAILSQANMQSKSLLKLLDNA